MRVTIAGKDEIRVRAEKKIIENERAQVDIDV